MAPIAWKVVMTEGQSWLLEILSAATTPIVFFLAFGLGLRGYVQQVDGMSYLTFLVPGLIVYPILLDSFSLGAWGLWLDRWHQGMVDEYRIKPITTSDIIIGQILGGFVVALLKGTVVATLLLLLSQVPIPLVNFLPLFLFVLPGSFLFNCLGTIAGTLFRKPDHIAQSMTLAITPLLYLGGVFFPLSVFPPDVQPWIRLLPTAALFEGAREALLHGTVNFPALGVVLVYGLLAFITTTTIFNRKLSE
jgi:lipooligosaccharide transport system permease protein